MDSLQMLKDFLVASQLTKEDAIAVSSDKGIFSLKAVVLHDLRDEVMKLRKQVEAKS